jgi:hypothetical protein
MTFQFLIYIVLFYKELLDFKRRYSRLDMSLEPDMESRRQVVQEVWDKDLE